MDHDGKVLGKDGLKSLMVELPNGDKLPAYYGGHPPASPTDYFWVVAWQIPASYPSGTFAYKATATDMQRPFPDLGAVQTRDLPVPGDARRDYVQEALERDALSVNASRSVLFCAAVADCARRRMSVDFAHDPRPKSLHLFGIMR